MQTNTINDCYKFFHFTMLRTWHLIGFNGIKHILFSNTSRVHRNHKYRWQTYIKQLTATNHISQSVPVRYRWQCMLQYDRYQHCQQTLSLTVKNINNISFIATLFSTLYVQYIWQNTSSKQWIVYLSNHSKQYSKLILCRNACYFSSVHQNAKKAK